MKDFSKYTIDKSATIHDALVKLDKLSSDVLTLFVMNGKQVIGTLTDGDIRRFLIKNESFSVSVESVMKKSFAFINPGEKNVQKIKDFRLRGVQLLPCLDETKSLLNVFNLNQKKSILPISAVLMAGGKGERLRPLTEKTPKPLLKLGDKAIIDYNIDGLLIYGVENIYVTTNYLAEQIEGHFMEERQGVKVNCIREKEYLGTIASVKVMKY
jgi:hypothetical protein